MAWAIPPLMWTGVTQAWASPMSKPSSLKPCWMALVIFQHFALSSSPSGESMISILLMLPRTRGIGRDLAYIWERMLARRKLMTEWGPATKPPMEAMLFAKAPM